MSNIAILSFQTNDFEAADLLFRSSVALDLEMSETLDWERSVSKEEGDRSFRWRLLGRGESGGKSSFRIRKVQEPCVNCAVAGLRLGDPEGFEVGRRNRTEALDGVGTLHVFARLRLAEE